MVMITQGVAKFAGPLTAKYPHTVLARTDTETALVRSQVDDCQSLILTKYFHRRGDNPRRQLHGLLLLRISFLCPDPRHKTNNSWARATKLRSNLSEAAALLDKQENAVDVGARPRLRSSVHQRPQNKPSSSS